MDALDRESANAAGRAQDDLEHFAPRAQAWGAALEAQDAETANSTVRLRDEVRRPHQE